MADAALSRLINLFFMTHRALHKHMQDAEIMTSFSFLQFITMKFVEEADAVSMKEIARFLSVTPASATALVNGLVGMGALVRTTDERDRRVVRLRVNAYGRRTLAQTDDRAKRELRRIFLQLTDQDRSMLAGALERLFQVIAREQNGEHGPGPSRERSRRDRA